MCARGHLTGSSLVWAGEASLDSESGQPDPAGPGRAYVLEELPTNARAAGDTKDAARGHGYLPTHTHGRSAAAKTGTVCRGDGAMVTDGG